MDIYDVVTKLIGPIDPVGETYEDKKRYENLKEMTDLVDGLMRDIYHVSRNVERVEHSMNKAGTHAQSFLNIMRDYTN